MQANRVLIAGAGAEVDLGFCSGKDFTKDTFYTKKSKLYDALAEYYKERVGSEGERVPNRYQKNFLFSYSESLFSEPLSSSMNFDNVDNELSDEEKKKLFDKLIAEESTKGEKIESGPIPGDAHFGILERYYSSILQPNKHLGQFWKLINFYWSAYFSILLPITDKKYCNEEQYQQNKYQFVLSRLDDIVCQAFSEDGIEKFVLNAGSQEKSSYYKALKNCFNGVITTNYTPYISYLVDYRWEEVAYLSGTLSMFEDPITLTVRDIAIKKEKIGSSEFVFPYLMTQSPVKPIINQNQVRQFSKALQMLKHADEIVVLGYSFCLEDAHIASMVGEELRKCPEKTLLFLQYYEKESNCTTEAVVRSQLKESLMLNEGTAIRQVKVEFIHDATSDAIKSLSKKKIY